MAQLSRNVAAVFRYFELIDSGNSPAPLFAADADIHFPKYGVGRGRQALDELGAEMMKEVAFSRHHTDDFVIVEQGDIVVVEGTSEGRTHAGEAWHGGKTPGGRFCSVFCFDAEGLIRRMHIYLDPDYVGADKARFRWARTYARSW